MAATAADTFRYTIQDDDSDVSTATVTIHVGSDNDAPVAVADAYQIGEDPAVPGLVVAAPGQAKALKRVPLLAYPQLGVSILWFLIAFLTCSTSMSCAAKLSARTL